MARLRGEEAWARAIISAELGLPVEEHDDGSSPGMYDLRIDPKGRSGAVEVTACADPEATETWNLINRRGEVWVMDGSLARALPAHEQLSRRWNARTSLTSALTVDRDPREQASAHRFPGFSDTEEVGSPTPPAPPHESAGQAWSVDSVFALEARRAVLGQQTSSNGGQNLIRDPCSVSFRLISGSRVVNPGDHRTCDQAAGRRRGSGAQTGSFAHINSIGGLGRGRRSRCGGSR
jgi:hypothetical protein